MVPHRMKTPPTWIVLFLTFLGQVAAQDRSNEITQNFNPSVSATCQGKIMVVTVTAGAPFSGIVHAKDKDNKDFRSDACSAAGNGESKSVTLRLNVIALPGDPDYCGVIVNEKSDDRRVRIAVRMHKTLELADDKYFTISCNKQSFRNARYEVSKVSLKFLDDGKRVNELYHGRQYTLRAETTKPDGVVGFKVVNCIGFSSSNLSEVVLIDKNGCPVSDLISKFTYNDAKGYADATIFSMFKYPDSRRVIIQCDVVTCSGGCPQPSSCPEVGSLRPQARTTDTSSDSEGNLMITTTAYVLEPGEASLEALPLTDCSIHRWSWLLGLCIAFGVLFLIMLIINIFLCSALTCTCTRQEIIEKEPSVIEDYDPYKGGWAGSHYGSRYSLNGKPGYTSGGSTLNSTTRSVSTNSDNYAIVHSHPGSRYSGHAGSHKGGGGGGGPGSTISHGGGQYNHAYNGRI